MSIIDKANEYIGHPREVDEGYEVSMRRDAYAQGYKDAIEKACSILEDMTEGRLGKRFITEFKNKLKYGVLERH